MTGVPLDELVDLAVSRLVGSDPVLDLDRDTVETTGTVAPTPAEDRPAVACLLVRDLLAEADDPAAALAAAAASHPDARLVAVVANAGHAAVRLAVLGGASPYGAALRPGHRRLLSRASAVELLAAGGWAVVHVHAVELDADDPATGVEVPRTPAVAAAAEALADEPDSRAAVLVLVAVPVAGAAGAVPQLVALLDAEATVLRQDVRDLRAVVADLTWRLEELGGTGARPLHDRLVEQRLEVMRLRDELVRHELGQAHDPGRAEVQLDAARAELDALRAYHALVVARMDRMDAVVARLVDPRLKAVAKKALRARTALRR